MLPIIAIIGRPNVGKSTMFNRLCGDRIAVTCEEAGTTRDRVYHEVTLNRRRAILVDSGGMDFGGGTLENDILGQTQIAIEEADVIVFLIDIKEPITANDHECADRIRKSGKPIVVVAHKADSRRGDEHIHELYELGLGEAIPVSSAHNFGINELESAIGKKIRGLKLPAAPPRDEKNTVALAIVGRPNVGKSSLLNSLLGSNRSIVSNIPGTTVDSIDTKIETPDGNFLLTDTAGIRRRGRIEVGKEKFGVLRTLQSISRADVACLLIDASEGVTNQDMHVSEFILSAYKGLIVIINKIDILENREEEEKKLLNYLHYKMNFVSWAPVIFISAQKNIHIKNILPIAKKIAEERKKRLSPNQLNAFLRATLAAHPPSKGGRKITFFSVVQREVSPPIFRFLVSREDLVHFSYRRFLENELRRMYGFEGTAIRLEFWDK